MNLLENVNLLHSNDIFSCNPDLEKITIYEQIAEIGQSAVFLKNNIFECIDIFGVSVTSDLIEESQIIFKSLIESVSSEHIIEGSITPLVNFGGSQRHSPSDQPNNITKLPKISQPTSIWDTISKHSKEIGWTVLAAIALAGAYKIYKNYFSKAAQACKGKSGNEKDACMSNYQVQAYKLKQQALKKSLSLANKTKDSSKFKNKINSEINKINSKIQKKNK